MEKKANQGRNCVSTSAPAQYSKPKTSTLCRESMVMALLVAVDLFAGFKSVLFLLSYKEKSLSSIFVSPVLGYRWTVGCQIKSYIWRSKTSLRASVPLFFCNPSSILAKDRFYLYISKDELNMPELHVL